MSIPETDDAIDLLPRALTVEYRRVRGLLEDGSLLEGRLTQLIEVCRRWFEDRGDCATTREMRARLDDWWEQGCPEPPARNRPRCGGHDGCWEDLIELPDSSLRCESCDITFGPSWRADERRGQLNLDGPDPALNDSAGGALIG